MYGERSRSFSYYNVISPNTYLNPRNQYDEASKTSFAFVMRLPNLSQLSNVRILDLYFSPLSTAKIHSFQNLAYLRLSHCSHLKMISLQNNPNLISLDCSNNKELEKLEILECPLIRAFDLSFSELVKNLPISFLSLEYFSLRHTKISLLPSLPKIKYLDISSTLISDISSLTSFLSLEILIAEHMKFQTIDFGPLTYLPHLTTIQSDISFISFTNPNPSTVLSSLWFLNSTKVEGLDTFQNFSACLPGEIFLGDKFSTPSFKGTWQNSYLLLYGPWPYPPTDLRQPAKVPHCLFPLPLCFNHESAAKSIMGAFFGAALADSLALFTDRSTYAKKEYLNFIFDSQCNITWSYPRASRREFFNPRGSYSEEIALLLLFMRSFTACSGEINTNFKQNIAKRLKEWIENGMSEHCETSPSSAGPGLSKTIHSPLFLTNPDEAAKEIWNQNGNTPVGFGFTSRSILSGCFSFWDEDSVIENAEKLCKITHFDPRCCYSNAIREEIIAFE